VLTDGRGGRKFIDPHIPPPLLSDLLSALKLAHARLLEPPVEVQEDERKLKHWKPKVRETVDWDAALDPSRLASAQEIPTATASTEEGTEEEFERRYVTVGLIGSFSSFVIHRVQPESDIYNRTAECWKIVAFERNFWGA
jgi:hypothetical protein